MNSKIADAIGLLNNPVALVWTDGAPEGASEFKAGRWGCVMSLIASVAAKGKSAAFSRETYGCQGGGVGLGFGNCYRAFPGGIESFYGFLADGNGKTEVGRKIANCMAQAGARRLADEFLAGERYVRTPETAKRFVDWLPMRDIPAKYVLVKPLSAVDPKNDNVQNVTFFVEPDALSALTILANYRDPDADNVRMAHAAGCQVMGVLSYDEAERERPRALVGMTDISARKSTRGSLGKHVMSLTVPWAMFLRMEEDVENSFLQQETWRSLQGKEEP